MIMARLPTRRQTLPLLTQLPLELRSERRSGDGLTTTMRTGLGALQAQLESTVRNLANVAENTAAAAGRVMDTDYAAETANLTKAQILQQAATSILAQANAQPQSVLALLQ